MIRLRTRDPAWDEWIEGVPRDVYHLAGYHLFAAGSGEGEPFMIVSAIEPVAWRGPTCLRRVDELEARACVSGLL